MFSPLILMKIYCAMHLFCVDVFSTTGNFCFLGNAFFYFLFTYFNFP